MTSVRIAWYRLMMTSETAPTKFFVSLASIFWGLLMFVSIWYEHNHVIHSIHAQIITSIAFVLYGVGLMWRIVDYKHRHLIACGITLFGAALWIATCWMIVFSGNIIPELFASNLSVALASSWLFIRAGSGEIITSKYRYICRNVDEGAQTCKFREISNKG